MSAAHEPLVGDPVPGAELYIEHEPGDTRTTRLDNHGAAIVPAAPGRHSLRIVARGQQQGARLRAAVYDRFGQAVATSAPIASGERLTTIMLTVDLTRPETLTVRLVAERRAAPAAGSKGGFAVGGFSKL